VLALRPQTEGNSQTGAIAISHSAANYRYTGLHVKVDKRFSSHYLFVASYALSKYTGSMASGTARST